MMSLWNFFFLRAVLVACLFCCCKADWLQELQNGRTITVGDGVQLRMDKITDSVNQTSFFRSHILRVFLGDVGFSLTNAKGKDGLQIGLFTPNADGSIQARGDANVFSVLLPLLIGFKIAGSIIATLVAVLVVSLKAFLASMISLILAGTAAVKKMMGPHPSPPEIHYPVDMYSHHPPMGYDYPTATGYNAPPHSAPSAPGPTGHDHEDHEEGVSVAESNTSSQIAASGAGTNKTTSAQYKSGVIRRVYRPRNRIVPVLTIVKRKEMRKLKES